MNSILWKVEELGLKASAGHTVKFSGCTWYKIEFGKEKSQSGRIIEKRWASWAKSLRAQFGGTTTWGNFTTSRSYQHSSVELSEKICVSLRFFLLWRRQRVRRSYVYCVFGSLNAQCWARRINLRYNGYLEKVQNTISDLPRPGAVQINDWAQVFVHDLDLFVTVQLLDETPAILLLHQFCSKRWYSCEWKTAKLHNWPKMGRQSLVQWTTQHFSLYQDCHHIPAAFCLQHRDQRISLIITENWEHYQIQ